jgi:hypothetical protein
VQAGNQQTGYRQSHNPYNFFKKIDL